MGLINGFKEYLGKKAKKAEVERYRIARADEEFRQASEFAEAYNGGLGSKSIFKPVSVETSLKFLAEMRAIDRSLSVRWTHIRTNIKSNPATFGNLSSTEIFERRDEIDKATSDTIDEIFQEELLGTCDKYGLNARLAKDSMEIACKEIEVSSLSR